MAPFRHQEQTKILALADEQERLAILLGLRAGLRHSEVLALRRKDVDMDGRVLADGSVPPSASGPARATRAIRPRTPFHRCRHTFASELLANGEPVLKVSRWLRHASAAFTLDVYGHLLPERNEHEAVDALDQGQIQDSFDTARGTDGVSA